MLVNIFHSTKGGFQNASLVQPTVQKPRDVIKDKVNEKHVACLLEK